MFFLRRHLAAALFPVFCFCGGFYFIHYAVNGEYGFARLAVQETRLAKLSDKQAALTAEREALEKRAALLSSRRLDADLFDERARALLGYAHPADLVIPVSALTPAS